MDRRQFMNTAGIAGGLMAMSRPMSLTAATESVGTDMDALPTRSRQAFYNFIETLSRVDHEYLSERRGVTSTLDVADGHRFVMHLLQQAIDQTLELDRSHPVLKRSVTPTLKLLGDNPDAVYYHAGIRGDTGYRIKGNRAGAVYFSVSVHSGGGEGNAAKIGSTINDLDMSFEPDGSFELILSPDDPGHGNWLRIPADAADLTTRHYFEEPHSVAADYSKCIPMVIEPIAQLRPPPAPTDESIAASIDRVSRYIKGRSLATPLVDKAHLPAWVSVQPNHIPKPEKPGHMAYAAVDNAYAMAPYRLADDEALIIDGKWPERCRFANVVLWNRYMQSYDYAHRQISLNRVQTKADGDGDFTMVIAHSDPGVANWLDTAGRNEGTMYWRYLLPEEDIQTPVARVVKHRDLKALFRR